ncbi:UrcA family protein [Phenylobacterium sp. J367]|uniref:UrcA family protein n=1 Tax=Phenylobacterium sp. J367 TaxID=2898435 RepID=UPI002151C0FC|nr:UrcA family protein [Phenylobacterium sp. J367]MCR5878528.1 UrcA family protein [Phenylobacterium sp. J367]
MTNRKMIAASAFAAALTIGAGATAAEDVMIVRTGDLNVSSHAGARAALRRIEDASGQYCAPDYRTTMSVARRETIYKCKKRMTEKAVAALGAPRVTALLQTEQSFLLARR